MFLFNLLLLSSGIPADGYGIYCNQDISNLFAPVLTGTGIYCGQDISGLFVSPLTGTGVYCSQDMSQF